MNDAYETLKTAFLLLVGITVGILGYLGKRTAERVDSLKETAVTRTELTEAIDKIEARQQVRHGENGGKLDRIAETMADIRTDVAVLKSESLFDDAGRLRR